MKECLEGDINMVKAYSNVSMLIKKSPPTCFGGECLPFFVVDVAQKKKKYRDD